MKKIIQLTRQSGALKLEEVVAGLCRVTGVTKYNNSMGCIVTSQFGNLVAIRRFSYGHF